MIIKIKIKSPKFKKHQKYEISFLRKVHVTRQTLEMLNDQYVYEPGTEKARNCELFKRNGIETFLISPQQFYFDANVRNVQKKNILN